MTNPYPPILSTEQTQVLLQPIAKQRVGHKQGQSHVEAYDIRAHLNRMFGFGNWDFEILDTSLLFDRDRQLKNGKDGCYVAYRVTVRITIRNAEGAVVAFYDGTAVGPAAMPEYMRAEAHDMAVKTAESQALKRAAINLGDQFGLSLYNGGSTQALVRKTVVGGGELEIPDTIAPEEHDVAVTDEPEPEPVHQPEQTQMPVGRISDQQIKKMQTMFGRLGIKDRDEKIRLIREISGTNVASSKELDSYQATLVIDELVRQADGTENVEEPT